MKKKLELWFETERNYDFWKKERTKEWIRENVVKESSVKKENNLLSDSWDVNKSMSSVKEKEI